MADLYSQIFYGDGTTDVTLSDNAGVGTEINTDYYTDVNLGKYRIELLSQDLTNEAGLANGASAQIIKALNPLAYRIKPQGGHTYIFVLLYGPFADNLSFVQDQVRGLGSSVGPNGIDCSGANVIVDLLD